MPKDSGSPVISLWLAWAFFQPGGLKIGRLQEKGTCQTPRQILSSESPAMGVI